jgi:hypothetical protein
VTAPRQGDVLVSNPSPLTGERERYTVVSADVYNAGGGPTVLIAEIETGTRYRASGYATETDYACFTGVRVPFLRYGSRVAIRIRLDGGTVSAYADERALILCTVCGSLRGHPCRTR